MYSTQLGYMHELTCLIVLLIKNHKGINPGELLDETKASTKDIFNVLQLLLTAGSISRFQNGFMINENFGNEDLK